MEDNTINASLYTKQRAIARDWAIRTRGMSLEEIANNKFLTRRMLDNHLYNMYFSMGDNPYAKMQIAKLDSRRILLDLEEYNSMIEATHKAVKDEANKALNEAVDDFLKEFNKK